MNDIDPTAGLLRLGADSPSLRVDERGTVRIGNGRITLDLVVEQYENGMSPEDMVRAYDTLELSNVHAAIAFYLQHKNEVQAYRKRRAAEAASLRSKIERERPRVSREELIARRMTGDAANAPAGQ
ncbi:MAG TPA: DUF433 domain-containing protein [Gemmataceae bacterium]|jgi:uncharacterized protein (DUF433 family)|nr:DUF433 domain-containing protein [Gemmataceae bacterium]